MHPHLEWFLFNSARNNYFPATEHMGVDGKCSRPKQKNGGENSTGKHDGQIAREQISRTERSNRSCEHSDTGAGDDRYQRREKAGYEQASDRESRQAAKRLPRGNRFGEAQHTLDE